MKKSLYFILIFNVILMVFLVYAADSYRVNDGTDTDIDEHSVCKNVDNNAGADLFVPTKTATEWSDFRSNPPTGVTLTDCSCSWSNVGSTNNGPQCPGGFPPFSACTCGEECWIGTGICTGEIPAVFCTTDAECMTSCAYSSYTQYECV